jgi:sodium/hydrogen exchanger 8
MSESHEFISENIILLCVLLILAVFASQVIDKYNITWLPASGAQIVLGVIVGAIVFLASAEESDFLLFRSDFFFFALLPPIIFEAGYSMKRTNFFRNVGSIMLFAFVGTVISTFVIGVGLHILANLGAVDINADDALDPLTFGALISAVDPIATLAILGNKQLRCDPMLYALVFGESVLNDAVAITLYQTFIGFRTESNFGMSEYWGAMGQFIIITIGSFTIGAIFALVCSMLLRKVNFTKKPSNEFIIIFFTAYACYCLAELTHLSGIMALFMCGIMQAHYAWYNISSVSRTTTRHAFHAFAHIAEAFLYVYLGMSAFFSTQARFGFGWSFSLIVWTCILCLLGRALNIFPLAYLANLGRKKKISGKMQMVMWFAGLRGAIAFALSLSMDSPIPGSDKYVTTTMIVVVLTTLGQGGSSNWLLNKLGLTGVEVEEEEHVALPEPQAAAPAHLDTADTGRIAQGRRICKNLDIHRTWVRFDVNWMQPLFGGRHAPRIEDESAAHDDHGSGQAENNPYLSAEVQAADKDAEDEEDEIVRQDRAGSDLNDLRVYDAPYTNTQRFEEAT